MFENQKPSDLERVSIDTMDETKRIPYLENELIQMLSKRGYREDDIALSVALQTQFKLIQKLDGLNGKESIISNEYVWGANHQKIARAISGLDFGKKQNLKEVIEIIQGNQGYPLDNLASIDKDLLTIAKKTGMITPTCKEFAFSPNMLEPLSYNDDILDDVKLLLASIRFGENYTLYSKILNPVKFLESLIHYGDIGPHDANSTDYTLLERKGIVKVVNKTKSFYGAKRTGYCLELIRKDVAEEALKVIKNPEYNINPIENITDYQSVVDTSKFISPEEIRVKLGDSPAHIKEAEDYLNRVLRDELL